MDRMELSESEVTKALKPPSWSALKSHLDEVDLDEKVVGWLIDLLMRHNEFVVKFPRPSFEKKRDALLGSLQSYLSERLQAENTEGLAGYRKMLGLIESGYRGIIEMLAQAEISRLDPAARVAAYIAFATEGHEHAFDEAFRAATRGGVLDMGGAHLVTDAEGSEYSPEAALGAFVETLGATLAMEAHRNAWWEDDGRLSLPPLVIPSADDVTKASVGIALGMLWRRWERAETRHRFFGDELRELDASEWPAKVPSTVERLLITRPGEMHRLDFIANARLDERFTQDFAQMLTGTGIGRSVVGIAHPAALPPGKFITVEEAHAVYSLSRVLAFDVVADVEDRGGLKLVEWIRGYAMLKAWAETPDVRSRRAPVLFELDEIVGALSNVGFTQDRARKFIELVTYARPNGEAKGSRDLYDCPIVATLDGRYVLVTLALSAGNIALATLSNVTRVGEVFQRKGKAFESFVRDIFTKNGLACHTFEHQRGEERYEFDAIVPWGDFVFLFECKNHGLSGYDPARAFRFAQGLTEDMDQVRRQAIELRTNRDLIASRLGEEWVGKPVIATLLNCLPYSIPTEEGDDICVSDVAVLRRFFEERDFYLTKARLTGGNEEHVRKKVASQWKSNHPTAEDLAAVLRESVQFKVMSGHTVTQCNPYPIDKGTYVLSEELTRSNVTAKSFTAAVTAGQRTRHAGRTSRNRAKTSMAANSVDDAQIARQRDREWREMRKRRTIDTLK
jgi:hypothetical protein